jgi:hypothetical protein
MFANVRVPLPSAEITEPRLIDPCDISARQNDTAARNAIKEPTFAPCHDVLFLLGEHAGAAERRTSLYSGIVADRAFYLHPAFSGFIHESNEH